jgi:hypothetical protein
VEPGTKWQRHERSGRTFLQSDEFAICFCVVATAHQNLNAKSPRPAPKLRYMRRSLGLKEMDQARSE